MHLGVSTPLVAMFVTGTVPQPVRLLAAQGQAGQGALERLALLAWLTGDDDPDVATAASTTIAAIPTATLAHVLNAGAPDPLRDWYQAWVPGLETELVSAVGTAATARDTPAAAVGRGEESVEDPSGDAQDDAEDDRARRLLSTLPVPDRVKIATLGRREQRAILIRDPNRVVATAVLASPKLTEVEVETFARMQNVSEEVLRIIGTSRTWTRNYSICASLAKNPRTPPTVSLTMLTRLNERDVKAITLDRNLPESVRLAARKHLEVQRARRGA